jgi:hypothetical protein
MDLFLNQLLLGAYRLVEGMIYAAGGILSAILSVLSISTYRSTGLPKVKYAIGAFALLSAFLFYVYLEIQFNNIGNNPYSEIILPSLVLASVMFFFLTIVRKR